MNACHDDELLGRLAARYGSPLWVMDAAVIRGQLAQLRDFDVVRFAQKANPNTHLLRLLREAGAQVDAVSRGEALRALAAGYRAEEIVYTADLLDRESLDFVATQRITVNAGSLDMLRQLGERSPGHEVWLRLNPGFGHGHSQKTNTGGEHSKHGIWHTELLNALAAVRQHGLKLIGLHMHIGSGVDYGHLSEVCGAMVGLVTQAHAAGHDLHALSSGGGLSTPYREGDASVDCAHYFGLWDAARKQAEAVLGHPVALEIEPGRYLVAESGVLVTEVRATKDAGRNHFVLVDAGFSELMRPAMYGAYHAMSLIPADGVQRPRRAAVVAGPLCESGDVFTQGDGGVVEPRDLPQARVGDLLLIHDTGAYGASMSSNYNSRPLTAEVLVEGGGDRLIRRRQTVEELLSLEACE